MNVLIEVVKEVLIQTTLQKNPQNSGVGSLFTGACEDSELICNMDKMETLFMVNVLKTRLKVLKTL